MQLIEFQAAVEELLMPELGRFPDGTPAIWVDAGNVPSQHDGLLCVIERYRNPVAYTPLANNQAHAHFDWVVRLITRDRSPPGLKKLDNAIAKMRARFPFHRERPLPPQDGRYPQITFLCEFHTLECTYGA